MSQPATATTSVGRPIDRVDGRQKVTGRATYAAEAPVAGCAHAVLVQSTISHGTIRSIDASLAERSPGVLAVLTPDNLHKLVPMWQPKKDFMGGGIPPEDRLPLVDRKIYYGGQHVAIVVAERLEQARHAAKLLRIEYDAKPPVVSMDDPAAKTDRPKESFGEPVQVQRGKDVDDVIRAGGDDLVVLRQTYTTPAETHNPMEPSAATAAWDGDGHLTVWDATQYVMGSRAVLAETFGIARDHVRVLCPFTGGGFGCKGFQWPHTTLAAAAAKVVKRPVKLALTRPQMFTSVGHRPPTIQAMTLVASRKNGGALVALRHDTTMHGSLVGEHVEACGTATSRQLYACPNVSIAHVVKQVHVNTPTPMRAPGECPGTYALESAMNELAAELNVDPLQLRLANHADANPHTDKPWSNKRLKECYQHAAEQFGWKDRNPKPRATRAGDGRLVGWGMATATYPGYRFPAIARVRLMPDASVAGGVRAIGSCATHDLGTGAYTVFTQATADAVGLPAERVRFELGDTTLPFGPVAGGSNSTASVTQAIADAAGVLRANLAKLAEYDGSPLKGLKADQLVLHDGQLAATDDPDRAVPLADLLARAGRPFVEGVGAPPSAGPPGGGAEKEPFAFQSFGCHFVEVRVDEPIGRVRVTRVVSAMDVGRVLNPKTARSQVIGGVVMGLGMALMEATEYEPRSGRPINDNLADYAVCVNADVPPIDVWFTDAPDSHMGPLGCRGVGEIGITGVAAAVAEAVWHATGRRVRDLPITPDKLL